MPKREIRGSRAIVTGASSGIGRAIARELAREGADLVVVARREQRLRELAGEIESDGGRVEIVAGDITEAACRQRAIDVARSSFGGLDILVNNAGIGALGLFEHAGPERVRRVMEVNFFALVEMTRLALPLLKMGTGPVVVNLGSILAYHGTPFSSEYCASKFAVRGFSESLRAELRDHEIGVLLVNPGTTETDFFDHVIERTGEPTWPEHAAVSTAVVARKTVRAIRRGRHEIIPGGWAKLLYWLNRFSPRLMDRIVARYT